MSKNEKKDKATDVESTFRTNYIVSMFIQGVTHSPTIVDLVGKEWGISKSQAYIYIGRAKEIFQEISEHDAKCELGMSIARLHDLYGRCMKVQDYRTCLQVQKEIKDLLGLGVPKKVDIDLTTRNITLSDELDAD